ncbi:hypothetical protein UFOVP650_10 [uncultured Caudovirales phage]|uniref:Uncharacterized protein n=1 Tax=uncultured Caudovirales phage TaxID=2100421 RepID=A0A6J5NBH7_9CAUD|nr:hypothetical protein UFOVP650_10 [uncultured Caudovirales phage]
MGDSEVFREEVTAVDVDVSEHDEAKSRRNLSVVDYSVGLDAVLFQAVPAFLVAGACRLRRRT